MDLIYPRAQATAAEVRQAMPDPPSYSAARALLRILEQKGHLRHAAVKGKYVYAPVRRRSRAGTGFSEPTLCDEPQRNSSNIKNVSPTETICLCAILVLDGDSRFA